MDMNKTIACILLFILAGLALCGCRSKIRQEFEFRNAELSRAIYEQEAGWSFWSEGPGKSINISPSVNGVQF